MQNKLSLNDIEDMVYGEFALALKKFKDFNTFHEGLSIIHEEFCELQDEVRKKEPDKEKLKKEASHVAAMAIRFMFDLCAPGVDGTGRRFPEGEK